MSSIKKPISVRKKQFKKFILSLVSTAGIMLLILIAFLLLNNNSKFSLEQTKKGQEYFLAKNYPKAEEAYKKALSADEKNNIARLALVQTLDLLEKDDDAVIIALKGVELNPGNIDFYRFVIQNYTKNNKIDKAQKFISEITIQPILLKLNDETPAPIKFSPNPGSYDRSITVTLTSDANSTIYYTIDGSSPNLNSPKYTTPLTVDMEKTNIKAIAINNIFLIGNEVTVSYNIYKDNQRYTFIDSKIEAIVRSIFSRPTGDMLYKDIITITRLSNYDINGKPIADYIRSLDDLLAMKSLTDLSLNSEPVIGNLSIFASLSALRNVNLYACGIDDADLKDICSAKWITSLKLDKNQITDLTQLTQLDSLSVFSASDNKISSIEPLGILAGIKELDLSKNNISNIESIKILTALKTLDLSSNKISSFNPFLSLTNLQELKLSNNSIQNISGIAVLSTIKTLNLSSNKIDNITPLSSLYSLNSLDLSNNKIIDLSSLSNLNLKVLVLINCGIIDLTPLSKINTLIRLDLKNNTKSTNISPYINDITDLSPISNLIELQDINLSLNTNLSNLKPLINCSKLTTIYCIDCPNVNQADLATSNIKVYYN